MSFIKKKILLFLIFLNWVVTATFKRKYHGVRVLALHDIRSYSELEEKIVWLKKNFHVLRIDEIFKDKVDNGIVITFDDGYSSWRNIVYPLFKKYQIPATFFLTSGIVSCKTSEELMLFAQKKLRRNKIVELINEFQLHEISECELFEIGGHTANHIDLGAEISTETFIAEIKGDKEKIEGLIGKKIRYFAYPFGSDNNISDAAIQHVRQCGYDAAFTIIPTKAKVDVNKRFIIGRYSIDETEPLWVWKAKLAGSYDFKQLAFAKNRY
jgi:peptidoglycan/xylan/chitin deacetylase (PgdA/CDA1 family)